MENITTFSAMDTTVAIDNTIIHCSSIAFDAKKREVFISFALGLDIQPLEIHGKDLYVRFATDDGSVRYPILIKDCQYQSFYMNIGVDNVIIEKVLEFRADLILDLEHLPDSERQKYEK